MLGAFSAINVPGDSSNNSINATIIYSNPQLNRPKMLSNVYQNGQAGRIASDNF
jgi:hypothetical protein